MTQKTYCFDLDGTLCTNTEGEYEKAVPIKERISLLNSLFDKNNKIIIFTARGYTTGINWEKTTESQLKKWGIKYHSLILGKPFADIYIDDKAIKDKEFFENYGIDSKNVKNQRLEVSEEIKEIVNNSINSLQKGGKLIFGGNGGSYSISEHISAELTGRFKKERDSLPAYVLGSNTSSLTAIANDYGYENIYSREISSIANTADTIILMSTSGNSKNIINAMKKAEELNINSWCLTGPYDSICSKSFKKIIKSPNNFLETDQIQEYHLQLGHHICNAIDSYFF